MVAPILKGFIDDYNYYDTQKSVEIDVWLFISDAILYGDVVSWKKSTGKT